MAAAIGSWNAAKRGRHHHAAPVSAAAAADVAVAVFCGIESR